MIPTQLRLRPALPTILGNVDYHRMQSLLERINELIGLSGIEERFVDLSLEKIKKQRGELPCGKRLEAKIKHSRRALRCMILMKILGTNYRSMSCRLAECPLFQWFCEMDAMGGAKVAGKSTLQRYHQWVDVGCIQKLIDQMIAQANVPESGNEDQQLKLANAVELETVWMDTTALKSNIHFPVDWVLLRDAVRTLMKATALIRRHGLKHRMADPAQFMKNMNGLAMAMCAQRRQKENRKARKRTFRQMKKLMRTVRNHAQRHMELLDEHWEQTDWTRKQAEQVLGRIDGVLWQLPDAIEQAHHRIIRGGQVKNAKKILSLYEPDVQVIVRGKAGAEVEFGNSLLVVEQRDGLIVDWKLHQQSAPDDSRQLRPSVERIRERFGKTEIKGVVGDRGFDSAGNQKWLKEEKIYNAVCPRKIEQLETKRHSGKFQSCQHRRAQTEGRIGVLKNGFFGRPMRQKGFGHREQEVGWNILAHNLWVLARLERKEESPETIPIAA